MLKLAIGEGGVEVGRVKVDIKLMANSSPLSNRYLCLTHNWDKTNPSLSTEEILYWIILDILYDTIRRNSHIQSYWAFLLDDIYNKQFPRHFPIEDLTHFLISLI